jgi:TonB family protein
MHLTLLESDRSLLGSPEYSFLSILAHAGVVWLVVSMSVGGRQLPSDEREAKAFFLLPPDLVETHPRQAEIARVGKIGGSFADGPQLASPGDGARPRVPGKAPNRPGKRSGALGELPFGPAPSLQQIAFTALQVDEMVERYEGSAAPVYPPELAAARVEGLVQAKYVVDTTGRVDTSTIRIVISNNPRFSESVRTALAEMRFRAAKRAGKRVRQLVEQRFRFSSPSVSQAGRQAS